MIWKLLASLTTKSRAFKQHDSGDIFLLMLNWFHEILDKCVTLVHLIDDITNSKPSAKHSLFHSENPCRIISNICRYESISTFPFTILSLSLSSGRCTLVSLITKKFTFNKLMIQRIQINNPRWGKMTGGNISRVFKHTGEQFSTEEEYQGAGCHTGEGERDT